MSSASPHFVIFSSYGNDSCALIQWAHEEELHNVTVLYSDTNWSAPWWQERVHDMVLWLSTLGFRFARTESIGFADLAREKKGFPVQKYQWCSWRLKIEPAQRWLDENDPDKRTVCLVGVRREESGARANYPLYMLRSESHGGRALIAPLAQMDTQDRDALLVKAGVEPLAHRSMECFPCINSNRKDLRELAKDTEAIAHVEALEKEIGRPMFRPYRHMGAKGIAEVIRWAESDRGKYESPSEEESGCESGWCGI